MFKNASVKNANVKKKEKKKLCIAIIYYKCKLSLFGRDNTKQVKSLIFLWSLKQNKFQQYKIQNKKQTKRYVIRT